MRGAYADFSDDNDRTTVAGEILRRFAGIPHLAVLYQFTLDDSHEDVTEYYTPRNLRLHRFGVHCDAPMSGGRLRLRYLPGYGIEDGGESRLVHAGNADVSWELKPGLILRPAAQFQRTPTYSSLGGSVSLIQQF